MRRFPVAILPCLLAAAMALFFGARTAEAQSPPRPEQEPAREPKPAPAAEAEADFWSRVSLELGFELDLGKFGAKHQSWFVSFPATLGYDYGGVIASVSVPYVIQRSTGNAVRVGGRVVNVGGTAKQPKTVGGLGDIVVEAGYYVLDTQDERPYLLLEGEVKIPTADDERGLGTGSADETLRASTGVTLWKHLKLMAELGYQWIGQPEDIPSSMTDFQNTINFGGGVGYKFNQANTLWAKFDGSTSVVPHKSPYALVYLEYVHTFANDSRFLATFGGGLTKSTPGLLVELSYLIWF
jgi:hypothetical protein